MLIASLDPFITQLVVSLGLKESLAAISCDCGQPLAGRELPRVTQQGSVGGGVFERMALKPVDCGQLRTSGADMVLTTLPPELAPDTPEARAAMEAEYGLKLSEVLGRTVKTRIYTPHRLDDVFEAIERMGSDLGVGAKGRELSQRARSQMLDWCDNFYDRGRSKRVTFISGIEPFKLGGLWIPDMIGMISAVSQEREAGKAGREVSYEEIKAFRPDVIIIAPQGLSLDKSARLFSFFDDLPGWEDIPAVKRGEVFFADGVENFYTPSLKLIDSMGILVSAMAGIDSGYITRRDSYYRLRWIELQRHRFT